MPVVITLPTPVGSTLAELRAEVLARGFDYLDDTAGATRLTRAINTAVSKVCRQDSWPFLQATGSGDGELAIGAFYHHPEDVRCDNRPLLRRTRQELAREGADFTRTGCAHSYFVDDGDTIVPFPLDEGVISAVWRHRPDKLVNGDDVCIVPSDYDDVVIDAAVRELEKDRHNWSAVQALAVEFETQIAEMRDSLLEHQAFVTPDGDA